MRTIRLHVDLPLAPDIGVALPAGPTGHLVKVLRAAIGTPVVLFNGDGSDYAGTLVGVGRGGAEVAISSATPVQAESPFPAVLAQGVARGERMDLILQKATELGVAGIEPLLTERTEVRLDADRLARRMGHWHAVVASACEQSGRARLPSLAEPRRLDAWLAVGRAAGVLRLFLDPHAERSPGDLPAAIPAGAVVAIGPEGGFSDAERARLRAAGFLGLRLGPRVLRTETAGLAALAVLQARYGDLG